MLRNTALASDFKHSHGDPTAIESLNVDVRPQKLSLLRGSGFRFRGVGVLDLGFGVLDFGFRVK